MKKEIKQKNKESNNKKFFLLLLLFLFLITATVINVSISLKRDILQIPTAPKISGGSLSWDKSRTIQVVEDAQVKGGISHYEYCVTDKTLRNCEWKKAKDKAIVTSSTGKYLVYFRGISNKNQAGSVSNKEEVAIDNESPIIKNIKINKIDNNQIILKLDATDTHSGIDKIYYTIGKETKETKSLIEIKNLEANNEYKIEITVVDKVGNKKIIEQILKTTKETVKEDQKEEPKEDLDDVEDLGIPTYEITPDSTEWSTYKQVEITYPTSVEKEYSLDSGKTWLKYTEAIIFTSNGKIIARSKKGEKTKDAEEIEIKFVDSTVPEISLIDVPETIEERDFYILPSSYKFGISGGEKICYLENKTELRNTNELSIGTHVITCEAKGNNGLTAKTSKKINVIEKEINVSWDGWITMTLFYPSSSTDREWRLGDPNSIRNAKWNPYLGSITVKLEDVESIYIRYKLNDEILTIPPAGKLLVDIEPEQYYVEKERTTEVKITYDKTSEKKEYKIGNENWKEYKTPFKVSSSTKIEARTVKTEEIFDDKGQLVAKRQVTGTDAIYIGEYIPPVTGGNGSTPEGPGSGDGGTYPDADYPNNNKPSFYLDGPKISGNPTSIVEGSVEVTVTPKEKEREIYIKIGVNGSFKKYTNKIELKENDIVYAYYIRESDGLTSNIESLYIGNIKQPDKPYVLISANPYPYYNAPLVQMVDIEISGSDYNTLEYSYDGINYFTYETKLTVTKNMSIYARGTNNQGVTTKKLIINNIGVEGVVKHPIRPIPLTVSIITNPDNSSTLINETEVTIQYDSNSTLNQYKLGDGELQTYTGAFKITSNTLITAYASNNTSTGQTRKKVDFLINGISAPDIRPNIRSPKTSQSVIVEIEYDKKASKKQYKINGGVYQNYTGAITITENCIIEAYNENTLGNKESSNYEITNIVPPAPSVVIERDSYYLLKLNYPSIAKTKEYKWTAAGEWKPYKNVGILLIKAGHKDKVLSGNQIKIKIEDENGNLIDFNGDYYIINEGFNTIMENVFIRWDVEKPSLPKIIPDTKSIVTEVNIGITYPSTAIKREYRIVYNDGIVTGWIPYNGMFKISKNATIYAKGENETGLSSNEATSIINNIDELPPVITVVGDLEKIQKEVPVQVRVLDDQVVDVILWDEGKHDEAHFVKNGTPVSNYTTVKILENGVYTFYAKDKVGRETLYHITVENIDNIPPLVNINVLTKVFGTKAEVEIEYSSDAVIKYYKIGASSGWKVYSGTIALDSNEIIDAKLQNDDYTLTIIARGIDAIGNQIEKEERISILDLKRPQEPIIDILGMGTYPILTEYGIKIALKTEISFEEESNVDKLYSIDNGISWHPYSSGFDLNSTVTKILAKTVKKDTGLESKIVTKLVSNSLPTDALSGAAYDGNKSTFAHSELGEKGSSAYYKNVYIDVDEGAIGKEIELTWSGGLGSAYYPSKIIFLDKEGTEISFVNTGNKDASMISIIKIPEGTTKIKFELNTDRTLGKIYEIRIYDEPKINVNKVYPKLTNYGIESGYNTVNLEYFSTSVKKLYKIGETGEWKDYNNEEIRLELGETIYAKGIDKNSNETITSTHKASDKDYALKQAAYDSNKITYVDGENGERIISGYNSIYLDVDQSIIGKELEIIWISCNNGNLDVTKLNFIDASGQIIETKTTPKTKPEIITNTYLVPVGTAKIRFDLITPNASYSAKIYEIRTYSNPILTVQKKNPNLTNYGTNDPYNIISKIDYFTTSEKKLYKIGENGEWKNYEGLPIRLEIGETIFAKGIDKNGVETEIINHVSVAPSNAISNASYDKNSSTYSVGKLGDKVDNYYTKIYMDIDSSATGKNLEIMWIGGSSGNYYPSKLYFEDALGQEIESYETPSGKPIMNTNMYTIPENAVKIRFELASNHMYGVVEGKIYEIRMYNNPVLQIQKNRPKLASYGVDIPYNVVTKIDYFATSEKKLYKIGETGEWRDYSGTAIRLELGQKIYAKGIDKFGVETPTVNYESILPEYSITKEAYDNNMSTFASSANGNQIAGYYKSVYLDIDASMIGREIEITWITSNTNNWDVTKLNFEDESGQVIETQTTPKKSPMTITNIYTVPANTKRIRFDIVNHVNVSQPGKVYEIRAVEEIINEVAAVLDSARGVSHIIPSETQ